MDKPDIPNGYLRVMDGIISELGNMAECSGGLSGEEIIDLDGRTLLPGFIDTHSHIGLVGTGIGSESDDINEDTDPCTPNLRAIDAINPMDRAFLEARNSGVTCAVVSPGSSNPVAGQICAIKTSGRWVDQMLLAHPMAVKFSLGENPKMTYGPRPAAPVTRMGGVAIIREALSQAHRYLIDMQKAEQEQLDPPEYNAKHEALLPVLRGEALAHFHAHKAYDILTALRIAEEFSIKLVIIHGTEAYLIADILAGKNIPVILGPAFGAPTKPELAGLSKDNCRLISKAGAEFAIATDYPETSADCLLLSAALAHSEGITRQQALYAITLGAAKIARLNNRVGSLTPGKDADLLVFSGDIFSAGSKPDMVFINGGLI